MSTRGLLGLVIDGEVKATYNHSDSYPSWLGRRALEFAAPLADEAALERTKVQARAIRLVDDQEFVPAEELTRLATLGISPDTNVGKSLDNLGEVRPNWYQALRSAQGDLDESLRLGVMTDGREFAKDSLFCEYGYLVNLDTGRVEFYIGFQQQQHDKGHFASPTSDGGYYPIAELASVPFAEIDGIDATLEHWEELADRD